VDYSSIIIINNFIIIQYYIIIYFLLADTYFCFFDDWPISDDMVDNDLVVETAVLGKY